MELQEEREIPSFTRMEGMSQEENMRKEFFDKQASETYDQRIKPIAPIIDNLHFLIRLILKDLPSDAHILCVGV